MSYSDNEPTVTAMERVIKQRDDLQARLSAAEEENERLKGHLDHRHGGENEEPENHNLTWSSVADLQARLSAAEEDRDGWRRQAQFEDRKRADLQARLASAEEHHTLAHQFGDDTEDLLDQLKRTDEVVEAAKALAEQKFIYPNQAWPDLEPLRDAIRRYEEGKK